MRATRVDGVLEITGGQACGVPHGRGVRRGHSLQHRWGQPGGNRTGGQNLPWRRGVHAWRRGHMRGEGGVACVVKGDMHGEGGMCGEGGHVWQRGACVAKGGTW